MEPDRVARARCGDGAAFEALVDARAGPMVRTAMAIPGNESDASDAVQDALVTAWRELASSPALGVDAPSRVSAGPFQVRSGLVVARHDPSAVITVDLPPVRCSLARGTVLPSCSDIADEAIAAVSP